MTTEGQQTSEPKWVNPCGSSSITEDYQEVSQLKDIELLNSIILQAQMALDHAKMFQDKFSNRTLGTDFHEALSLKAAYDDWLPNGEQIPKKLGQNLSQEYLKTLEIDTALLDAYEYMQKYAVGLEQIVWDEKEYDLYLGQKFQEAEYQLRALLCELNMALAERAVAARPDVTRDAMPDKYRAMASSQTNRSVRDFVIYRDYMNGLEYVIEVFQHLSNGLQS